MFNIVRITQQLLTDLSYQHVNNIKLHFICNALTKSCACLF